ncbi:MAG: hypothetical protein AVDCRST_MAG70-526, partial [uncultured Thermomicrobiales bacterium]
GEWTTHRDRARKRRRRHPLPGQGRGRRRSDGLTCRSAADRDGLPV